MTRDNFISAIVVILFFTMAIMAIIALSAKHSKLDQQLNHCVVQEYTVKSGDTLWDIAKKNKPAGYPIREYVYKIERLNDITSKIFPGQKIKIYTEGGDPSGKTIFGDID